MTIPNGNVFGPASWNIWRASSHLPFAEYHLDGGVHADCFTSTANVGVVSVTGWFQRMVKAWCPDDCECPEATWTSADGHAVVTIGITLDANNCGLFPPGRATAYARAGTVFGGMLSGSALLDVTGELQEGDIEAGVSFSTEGEATISFDLTVTGDTRSTVKVQTHTTDQQQRGCAVAKRIRVTSAVSINASTSSWARHASAVARTEVPVFSPSTLPPVDACDDPPTDP